MPLEVRFPGELLRLGTDASADRLMVLMRVAMFADPVAGDAYLASVPFRVLHVRTPVGDAPALYGAPELRPRTPPDDEHDLSPRLDELARAVAASVGAAETAIQEGFAAAREDGFGCISEERT